jgi:hypothetical protein
MLPRLRVRFGFKFDPRPSAGPKSFATVARVYGKYLGAAAIGSNKSEAAFGQKVFNGA